MIDRSLQIWADAVCINQQDLDERSSQVGVMGDIYKAAKDCQIWLGTVNEIKYWPDERVVSAFLRSHPYIVEMYRKPDILSLFLTPIYSKTTNADPAVLQRSWTW